MDQANGSKLQEKELDSQQNSFIPRQTTPDGKEVIHASQLADLILRSRKDLVDEVLNTFFHFYEECIIMDNKTVSENPFPLDLIQIGQAYFGFAVKSIGGWIDAMSVHSEYKANKMKKTKTEQAASSEDNEPLPPGVQALPNTSSS